MSEQHPVPLTPAHHPQSRPAMFLKKTESTVLFCIALVLSVLAVLLLFSSIYSLFVAVTTGQIRDQAIEILDSILLVMMTMEIVYTVTISIESHKLDAEPFLVVGAIAAIRRMLVITAESTKMETNIPAFQNMLMELGLLAGTIILIACAVYILRRSQAFLPPEEE
ncbi:MAG: phosphate-starvation-inducible PsiE family protein [Anaerolineales bacterium]